MKMSLKRYTQLWLGVTLVEILAVVAIIAVLAAVLLPVLFSAKRSARGAECMEHLRQLFHATTLYVDDYDGKFPLDNPRDGVIYGAYGKKNVSADPLKKYGATKELYQCGVSVDDSEDAALMSDYLFRFVLDLSQFNSNKELDAPVQPQTNSVVAWDWHHAGGGKDIFGAGSWLVLYFNGSVKQIKPSALRKSYWRNGAWTFDPPPNDPNTYYEFVFPNEDWPPTLSQP